MTAQVGLLDDETINNLIRQSNTPTTGRLRGRKIKINWKTARALAIATIAIATIATKVYNLTHWNSNPLDVVTNLGLGFEARLLAPYLASPKVVTSIMNFAQRYSLEAVMVLTQFYLNAPSAIPPLVLNQTFLTFFNSLLGLLTTDNLITAFTYTQGDSDFGLIHTESDIPLPMLTGDTKNWKHMFILSAIKVAACAGLLNPQDEYKFCQAGSFFLATNVLGEACSYLIRAAKDKEYKRISQSGNPHEKPSRFIRTLNNVVIFNQVTHPIFIALANAIFPPLFPNYNWDMTIAGLLFGLNSYIKRCYLQWSLGKKIEGEEDTDSFPETSIQSFDGRMYTAIPVVSDSDEEECRRSGFLSTASKISIINPFSNERENADPLGEDSQRVTHFPSSTSGPSYAVPSRNRGAGGFDSDEEGRERSDLFLSASTISTMDPFANEYEDDDPLGEDSQSATHFPSSTSNSSYAPTHRNRGVGFDSDEEEREQPRLFSTASKIPAIDPFAGKPEIEDDLSEGEPVMADRRIINWTTSISEAPSAVASPSLLQGLCNSAKTTAAKVKNYAQLRMKEIGLLSLFYTATIFFTIWGLAFDRPTHRDVIAGLTIVIGMFSSYLLALIVSSTCDPSHSKKSPLPSASHKSKSSLREALNWIKEAFKNTAFHNVIDDQYALVLFFLVLSSIRIKSNDTDFQDTSIPVFLAQLGGLFTYGATQGLNRAKFDRLTRAARAVAPVMTMSILTTIAYLQFNNYYDLD